MENITSSSATSPQERQQVMPVPRRPAQYSVLRKIPRPGQGPSSNGSVRPIPYEARPVAAADIARRAGVSESALLTIQAGYAAAEAEKRQVHTGKMAARACVYQRKEYTKKGSNPVLKAVAGMRNVDAGASSSLSLGFDRVQTGRVEKPRVKSDKERSAEEDRKKAFVKRQAALKRGEAERAIRKEEIKQKEWGMPKKRVVPIAKRSFMQRLAAGNAKKFAPKGN